MERVTEIVRAGHWPSGKARDAITLAYQDRHRRRMAMRSDGGIEFLLDLADAVVLREGDGLVLPKGGYVRVRAAIEPLLEISARSSTELARFAWHLGNRHLPAQVENGRIKVRADHVIADMMRGLGAVVREVMAPFDPESGAYSGVDGHRHHDHGNPRQDERTIGQFDNARRE